MAELDAIDLRILAELQADGRITNVELASRVGLSAPPCLRRVRRLEEAGVLERSVVDSRPPYVEYRLTQRGRQLRSLVNALSRFAEAGAGTA